MSEQDKGPEVFDIDRLRELIELMKEHDLSEVDLKQPDRRIRLRRGAETPVIGMPAVAPVTSPAASASVAPSAQESPSASDDSNAIFINSPMVGTFYSRPKPDAEPFVKVGDVVQEDTVVCIVEAMKTFNPMPAGVSGKIVEVLVKDEDPVDVNRPLFKLSPV